MKRPNWFVRRFGPRCGHVMPWKVNSPHKCRLYAGHEQDLLRPDHDWHADGAGYIWNEERWQWRGPRGYRDEGVGGHD